LRSEGLGAASVTPVPLGRCAAFDRNFLPIRKLMVDVWEDDEDDERPTKRDLDLEWSSRKAQFYNVGHPYPALWVHVPVGTKWLTMEN